MTNHKNDEPLENGKNTEKSRRDFLKGGGVVAGGLAAAAAPGIASAAESQGKDSAPDAPSKNPYGARPGGGISLPEYYQPWPAIKNRNMYLPGTEILPKNEMRISFMAALRSRYPRNSRARACWSNWATARTNRVASSSTWAVAAFET